MSGSDPPHASAARRARRQSLAQKIDEWLDLPMAILAVVWVAVTVEELVASAEGKSRPLISRLSVVLWMIFLLEFLFELALASDKGSFLRKNWLAAVSVALPFLSVLRIFRAGAALGSLARGPFVATTAGRTVTRVLVKNRLGQVLILFASIVALGGASIFSLESRHPRTEFTSFGFTVYWAACMATTVNFGPEPLSLGGRLISLGLRVCGVAFFGYVAGGLASWIFGVRLSRPEPPPEGPQKDHR
jgi:voltage-gated potassium channel